MPNHVRDARVHAMSGSELSRVRTEFDQPRIVPTVPPHPVQPNREFPGHGHLGNAFLSSHRQAHIPTPPVRVLTHRCLRCFSQQEAQQGIALLTNVSQPLLRLRHDPSSGLQFLFDVQRELNHALCYLFDRQTRKVLEHQLLDIKSNEIT